MRCPECKRTGFTEDELLAHENKSGHKIGRTDTGRIHPHWASGNEFAPSVGHTLSKNELLEAMAQMLTKEDLKVFLEKLINPATEPVGQETPPA